MDSRGGHYELKEQDDLPAATRKKRCKSLSPRTRRPEKGPEAARVLCSGGAEALPQMGIGTRQSLGISTREGSGRTKHRRRFAAALPRARQGRAQVRGTSSALAQRELRNKGQTGVGGGGVP